ncbi:putative quinol monooxygenase [Methanobrevibacter sp.]|uniref:putative quinol monooxygenase n=1 Tax=Methanobrevibacter sp. TaxID=66852 RepID=UPI00388EEE03
MSDIMIIVLAKAIPKDENAKMNFISVSSDLIEKSKAEEGNIDYNLYDDVNADSLMFVEKWKSVEDLQNHMQTEHFIKFGQNIQNLVACELEIEVFSSDKLEF